MNWKCWHRRLSFNSSGVGLPTLFQDTPMAVSVTLFVLYATRYILIRRIIFGFLIGLCRPQHSDALRFLFFYSFLFLSSVRVYKLVALNIEAKRCLRHLRWELFFFDHSIQRRKLFKRVLLRYAGRGSFFLSYRMSCLPARTCLHIVMLSDCLALSLWTRVFLFSFLEEELRMFLAF